MHSFRACNHGSAAIAPLSLFTGMGGAPSVTTHTGFSATSRKPSASALGDLRVTERGKPFTPPAAAVLCSSSVILLCRLTAPIVSFGAPIDQMSIAASGDGQWSTKDEDLAGLTPSGAAAELDPELTIVLSRAIARLSGNCPSCSLSSSGSRPVCSSYL